MLVLELTTKLFDFSNSLNFLKDARGLGVFHDSSFKSSGKFENARALVDTLRETSLKSFKLRTWSTSWMLLRTFSASSWLVISFHLKFSSFSVRYIQLGPRSNVGLGFSLRTVFIGRGGFAMLFLKGLLVLCSLSTERFSCLLKLSMLDRIFALVGLTSTSLSQAFFFLVSSLIKLSFKFSSLLISFSLCWNWISLIDISLSLSLDLIFDADL